ncbi:MAG: SpoIID/LytB domain-containing protein [Actinobacteria bacterium]|nr:SpoIID/LytB domain-containing protein [Actinomycetota bacterium]
MGILRLAVALLVTASFTSPAHSSPVIPASFVITGAGLGHGVGMSQVGAFVQAQNGRSAAEIIAHYYPNSELITVDDQVEVLVNVATNQTNMTLQAATIKGLLPAVLTITGLEAPLKSQELLTISATDGIVQISANQNLLAASKSFEINWSGVIGFDSTEPKSELVLTRADNSKNNYRFGPLLLTASGNKLQAVLKLNVKDEYLNAVAEMASTWPAAALQAQAIASRSIALNAVRSGTKSSCRCHLNFTGDQNMRGSERYKLPGYSNWRKAVKQTAGQVVGVGGQPVAAWFFARSNGKTENSQDVWGSPRPWAISVEDQYSLDPQAGPQVRWNVPVTTEQLAKIFNLPDVVKVRVVARNAGGSVKTFRATASSGATADLPGRTLRAAIPTRSVWILSIKPVGS